MREAIWLGFVRGIVISSVAFIWFVIFWAFLGGAA